MTRLQLDDLPQCRTLADVLRYRAAHQSNDLAYRFLPDGESRELTLTYGVLDARARAIAACLQPCGAGGERVLLVYPPGLEFVCAWFGCAYAAAIPVVVQPPHRARARRFMSSAAPIAGDARPALALSTTAILEDLALGEPAESPDALRAVRWLATDGELEDRAPRRTGTRDNPRDIAFLQYTSGSTTTPRGVIITHENLMQNLAAIRELFWAPSDRGSVCWLPPYHDMGLIGGVLAPVYLGSPATLMSPMAFVQRPLRWLSAIARFRAAVSGGPNFAYDLCLRKIRPDQHAGLDLSCWRVAFNGAEPISARTVREFTAVFAPWRFRAEAFKPCYGLAESTLLVSACETGAPPRIETVRQTELAQHRLAPCADATTDTRPLVSSGRPATPTIIVDAETLRRCAPGQVGEIWVSGPGVASGYWNRPEETEKTFHAHLGDGTGPFLRTGDLGFLLDGELFVTGRLKDLIIVDGANHYPQDIEGTVGVSHPALDATDCAAFAVPVDDTEALVVVAAVQGVPQVVHAGVHRAIRTALSEQHDLRAHDVVLVRRGAIPKTSSGKVRRHVCRTAYMDGTLDAWRAT